MSHKVEFGLVMPFFSEEEGYVAGFEAGWIQGLLDMGKEIESQWIHKENKEQIELICITLDVLYKIVPYDADWCILRTGIYSINEPNHECDD
jgi:hypothetical protein